jgi:hypothetical protein
MEVLKKNSKLLVLQRRVEKMDFKSGQPGLAMRQVSLIIALLVIPNPLQSSCGIKNRFGQYAGQQKAGLLIQRSPC